MSGRPPSPQRPVTFRPRFTLTILYVALFFFAILFAFALPEMLDALRTPPPASPEERELAQQALAERVQEALRGRVPIALAAAVVLTGLGAYTGRLPGLGER